MMSAQFHDLWSTVETSEASPAKGIQLITTACKVKCLAKNAESCFPMLEESQT